MPFNPHHVGATLNQTKMNKKNEIKIKEKTRIFNF
jgi:hypothetical protein